MLQLMRDGKIIKELIRAADRPGGDFYDMIELEDQIIFYVSDVSGHDLSSSMLNIFLKEAVNSYLLYHHDFNKGAYK